jgi:hypothetical protein
MNELKEAELKQKAARDAVSAQLATIKTVESRLGQIDSDLQKFGESLGEAAVTNNQGIDWARLAADRLGLELEKATLPAVIVRLKEPLPALQAAANRADNTIDRLMKENSEAGQVETIRKMLDEGKTQRLVKAECALAEHDFYRVLAKAKRA